MSDRPEILMPVSPAGAVEQMMLEELRRARSTGDRLLDAVTKIDTQLALLEAATRRAEQDRNVDRLALEQHSERINKLESWRDKHDGATGVMGWLINSPLLGWLAAALAIAWTALSGKGHS